MTSQVLTFDTETNGANVTVTGPILALPNGTPTYDSDGIHGTGIRFNGGTSSNVTAQITLGGVTSSHSGSFYWRANTIPATNNVTFCYLQSTSSANQFTLRYTSTGAFSITDSGTAQYTSSTGLVTAGAKFRFDYQYTYVASSTCTLAWRLFYGANLEGRTADLSGSVSITSGTANAPSKYNMGAFSGAAVARDTTIDTIRTIDGAVWLGPYIPVTVWNGSAEVLPVTIKHFNGSTENVSVASVAVTS